MNRYHLLLIWTVLLVITLGGLVKLAMDGATVAVVILAVLGALLLVGFGVIITLFAIGVSARRDQANFMANARENLSIMQAMQRVINAQNTQLLRQVQKAGQLPAPENDVIDLVEIDESIFDTLDE